MILICKQIGETLWRLCGDGQWRDFALFGTYASCVKQYRYIRAAHRTARKLGGVVVVVPKGMSVQVDGLVIETLPAPDRPDYVIYKHHKLQEFIQPDDRAAVSNQTV